MLAIHRRENSVRVGIANFEVVLGILCGSNHDLNAPTRSCWRRTLHVFTLQANGNNALAEIASCQGSSFVCESSLRDVDSCGLVRANLHRARRAPSRVFTI